ncbi:MAG: response regulator receiver sensor hybrid histidine kinase [Myxococcales bacterium]|nr:response regulator receiver sensor hybrid histidine kinase [Myxococcales bacterium]
MSEVPARREEVLLVPEPARPAVLVVDDNHSNLVAMEALLSALDLEVAVAASGQEALKQLLRRDFAVVLMDVQMPGLDGFATTELIRQRDRCRHTPIIFVTAIFTDEASAKKAYSLGALDFVTKPFDEAILKAKVGALVGHYRQADVIERQAEALRAKQREADRANTARDAAEAANRAKDEFLAMLSHELRAPLHSILGWATRLESETDLSPRAARAAQTIARSARAQNKLIDELLDVSQIVAEKLTIDSGVVDLDAIVQSAVASMEATAADKRVRVGLTVAPGRYTTAGDGRRLEQLVCHLLSNAIKFSNDGGQVAVELLRSDAGFRLRIRDEGIGIGAEFLPHVFERFRQSDGTRTRRHGGLGIGLTVARRLAELHDGSIEASSAGLDRGAEFVLTLPRVDVDAAASAAMPAAAPLVPSAEERPLDGLRLLFVDDDPDARDLTSTILEDAGGAVVTAASAAEALAAFEGGTFDVVVSDLGMPDEDGLTLVKKLRTVDSARGGSLVAVAVSGYGSNEDLASSRRAGFDAHVVKPCTSATLVALITRLTKSV